MDTSNILIGLIRDIIKNETSSIDRALICKINNVNIDGTLDIIIPSDPDNVLKGISNNSPYLFNAGDYGVLYKIGNNLNNSFVFSKVTRLPPEIGQNNTYITYSAGSSESGGNGSGDTTVYVGGEPVEEIYFTIDPQIQLNTAFAYIGNKLDIDGNASQTTVDFTAADSQEPLVSGDNQSTLWSKTSRWITDLNSAIENKLDVDGNASNTTVDFTTAEQRLDLSSGDNQSTLWGKTSRWLLDLGDLAFLNKVSSGYYENGSITNTDINASAGISFSKMEALPSQIVVVTDGNGNIVGSNITNAELDTLHGIRSNIQEQIDLKLNESDLRYFSYNANGSIGNGTMVMTYDLDNPSAQWLNANIGYNNSNISGNGIVFGINNNGSNESVIIGNNWGVWGISTPYWRGITNSVIIGDGNNINPDSYVSLENAILLQPLNSDYTGYISNNSIGIGIGVRTNVGGISIGEYAASGTNGVSIGEQAVSGTNGVSIGSSASSSANGSSIGTNSHAGPKSVSIGLNSRTLNSSVAIGDGANAVNSSISIGSNVTSDNGVSIGRNITSPLSVNNAISIGSDISTNANAISFGRGIVSENGSIIIGDNFIEDGLGGTIGFGRKISVNTAYFEDHRLFSPILIGENITASTTDSNNSPIAFGKNLDVGDNNIHIGKNISGYGIALGDKIGIGLNTAYTGGQDKIAIGTQIGFIHSKGDVSIGTYVDSNDSFSISIGRSIIVDGYDQFGKYASPPYSRGIYIGEYISSNVSSSILIGSRTTSDGCFKRGGTGSGYRFFPGIAIGEYSSTHNGSISIGTNATGIFPGSVHIYTDYIDDTISGCDSDHLNYSKSYVAIGGYNASSIIPDHQFNSNLNASFDNLLTVGGVPIVKRWGNDSWQFNNSLMNLATDWQQFPQAANNPMAFSLGIDLYNSVAELNGCVSDLSVELNDAESNIATLFATKINYTDIVDNHTSSDANAPLSANQGRVIYQEIGNCVSSAIDALPSWSKQPNKPTYTAAEVGAEPAFSKNTAFNKNFGNTADTVCEGDDPRLYDSRPASDVPSYVKAISEQEINNWNNTSSLGIDANDVANWTEGYGWYESLNGSVTYENAQNWNNMSNSPAANITDAQINKWDGIYLSPNVSLSEFTFNSNIIPEKVETVLANVSYDISPGPGMPNMIGSLIDTYDIPSANKAYGIYSVDLNAAGGTGYALAVCSVQGYDFYVEQPIYITEYSAQNEGIIQMFPGLSEFTYTSGGWQNTDTYQLPDVAKIYDVYDYKACSFVGNNMTKRFWDIMWMFDPTTVINNTLTQINSGSGV